MSIRVPKDLGQRAIVAGERRTAGRPRSWLLRLECGHVLRRPTSAVESLQRGGRLEFTPGKTFCALCDALGRAWSVVKNATVARGTRTTVQRSTSPCSTR